MENIFQLWEFIIENDFFIYFPSNEIKIVKVNSNKEYITLFDITSNKYIFFYNMYESSNYIIDISFANFYKNYDIYYFVKDKNIFFEQITISGYQTEISKIIDDEDNIFDYSDLKKCLLSIIESQNKKFIKEFPLIKIKELSKIFGVKGYSKYKSENKLELLKLFLTV